MVRYIKYWIRLGRRHSGSYKRFLVNTTNAFPGVKTFIPRVTAFTYSFNLRNIIHSANLTNNFSYFTILCCGVFTYLITPLGFSNNTSSINYISVLKKYI